MREGEEQKRARKVNNNEYRHVWGPERYQKSTKKSL